MMTPRALFAAVAVIALAVIGLVGVNYWRGHRTVARAKQEQRADTWRPIAEARGDSLARARRALAHSDSALALEIAKSRALAPVPSGSHVGDKTTPTASALPATTSADSLRALLSVEQRAHDVTRQALATTRGRLDSLVTAADSVRLSLAEAERRAQSYEIARDSLLDALTQLRKLTPPRRRWTLAGCSVGPSALVHLSPNAIAGEQRVTATLFVGATCGPGVSL